MYNVDIMHVLFFFETWNLNARVTHVTFCLHSQTLDCSEDCVQVQMDLSVLNLIPVSCKIVLAPPYIYFGAGRKEAHIKEYSGWCGPGCPGPARRAIICLRGYNTAAVALLLSIKCIIILSSYHHSPHLFRSPRPRWRRRTSRRSVFMCLQQTEHWDYEMWRSIDKVLMMTDIMIVCR